MHTKHKKIKYVYDKPNDDLSAFYTSGLNFLRHLLCMKKNPVSFFNYQMRFIISVNNKATDQDLFEFLEGYGCTVYFGRNIMGNQNGKLLYVKFTKTYEKVFSDDFITIGELIKIIISLC